jgi:predicted RND superfamily exporter protein
VTPNTPVVSEIGVYAIAGILMATTVAIVTGLCWLSWLKHGNLGTAISDVPD